MTLTINLDGYTVDDVTAFKPKPALPLLPEVHIGAAGIKPSTELSPSEMIRDLLDDDSDLAVTPPDVIQLLGFDPKELDDE